MTVLIYVYIYVLGERKRHSPHTPDKCKKQKEVKKNKNTKTTCMKCVRKKINWKNKTKLITV